MTTWIFISIGITRSTSASTAGIRPLLTDTQVEKLKFANAAGTRLERFGKGRFLAERGEAEIECSVSPGGKFELYRVDTSGKRLGRVPFSRSDSGAIRFDAKVFSPDGTGFLYELVRSR